MPIIDRVSMNLDAAAFMVEVGGVMWSWCSSLVVRNGGRDGSRSLDLEDSSHRNRSIIMEFNERSSIKRYSHREKSLVQPQTDENPRP